MKKAYLFSDTLHQGGKFGPSFPSLFGFVSLAHPFVSVYSWNIAVPCPTRGGGTQYLGVGGLGLKPSQSSPPLSIGGEQAETVARLDHRVRAAGMTVKVVQFLGWVGGGACCSVSGRLVPTIMS